MKKEYKKIMSCISIRGITLRESTMYSPTGMTSTLYSSSINRWYDGTKYYDEAFRGKDKWYNINNYKFIPLSYKSFKSTM